MKLSNLRPVLEMIGERNRTIRERDSLSNGEFALYMSRGDSYEGYRIPDEIASVDVIRKTLIDNLNHRIKQITSDLRELGVQADTEDLLNIPQMYKLY